MDTSSDNAIESEENFRLDGGEEPTSVLEVDIPEGINKENEVQSSEVYNPEVEDISEVEKLVYNFI